MHASQQTIAMLDRETGEVSRTKHVHQGKFGICRVHYAAQNGPRSAAFLRAEHADGVQPLLHQRGPAADR